MFTNTVWFSFAFMFALCDASDWIIRKDFGFHHHKKENGTVHTAIQSTRKTLKRIRKWKAAHKAEVNLAKCISKYFNYDLPGQSRRGDFYDDDDVFDVDEYDSFPTRRRRQNDQLENSETRGGNGLTLGIGNEERRNAREAGEVRQNKLAYLSNSDSHFTNAVLQTDTKIDISLVSRIWDTLSLLCYYIRLEIYEPFLAPLWNHKLFSCGKDYGVAKFWEWVDAAPE